MKYLVLCYVNLVLVSGAGILRLPESAYKLRQPRQVDPRADVGEPLFLSPLIDAGEVEVAWDESRVALPGSNVESHSGYFTVKPQYNSNLFFWFFPALVNPAQAPVVLWLNGGPGASSLFGLFGENGPFYLDEALNLIPRNYSWATEFNMIYIDNPVGTGYSFTGSDAGYATTEEDVADDLYSAVQQFFAVFPYHRDNEFYITGESYAGKYIPALAYKIHNANKNATEKINLIGMAIGNGQIDPVTMFDYGPLLYTIGLIDDIQQQYFLNQTALAQTYIANGQWLEAFRVFDYTLNGDLWPYPTYFENVTGFVNYFNYLYSVDVESGGDYHVYVQQDEIRKAIHVGNLTFNNGVQVEEHLMEDIMKSTKSWVETILDNDYRVLIYSGQLDIVVGTVLTSNFLKTLSWKYSAEFQAAERLVWKVVPGVNEEVSGYVKEFNNFSVVTVRNSGHMVPTDQPRVGYEMITNFIFNRTYV